MLVDVAIDEVKRLTNFFEEYKETGFTQAMTVAKGIATEMEIDYVFNETCKTHRKNHAENVNESSPESVEESFRIHYFLHIVDQVIGLLKRIMFEQFQAYEDVFGFALIDLLGRVKMVNSSLRKQSRLFHLWK
ncbi:PREDICTED: zinc finger MYM-type [Prunus dulcis]|uniref:PREDICTED: zinc finger MYM-type n=1 Tax=Prunus dulcis TaxID=3755 RepID=A0A5E4E5L6_PRUDU|nr:PREDICTED: zinc finger MYM-type [Prunus dulcis]